MPDLFLRRFKKRHCQNGIFSPEAFECEADEGGLSFHKREGPLVPFAGVREYQSRFARPSGDLFGVCEVMEGAFEGMALPVREPPPTPEAFAEQHHELRPCPSPDQSAQLAMRAAKLLDYKKAR